MPLAAVVCRGIAPAVGGRVEALLGRWRSVGQVASARVSDGTLSLSPSLLRRCLLSPPRSPGGDSPSLCAVDLNRKAPTDQRARRAHPQMATEPRAHAAQGTTRTRVTSSLGARGWLVGVAGWHSGRGKRRRVLNLSAHSHPKRRLRNTHGEEINKLKGS